MLSCMGLHWPKCFKPVTGSDGISKVSKNQRCLQMRAAIDDIASEASRFANHIVPNSPSAIKRLKGEHSTVSDKNRVEWESTIQNTRVNMVNIFKEDIVDLGWEGRHCAVVHSHSEYAMEVVKTKTGNCAEKAFLGGLLLKATLISGLKLRGFSEEEIAKADIQLTIVELKEPGNENNEHTVCLLSYNIGGEKLFIVDPWINGAVVDQNEVDQFFADHINNLKNSLIQTKVHKDKTNAVNDHDCMSIVMEFVASQYEINLDSPHPFEKYV